MKTMFRKAVSVLTSVAMIGSTAAMAAAVAYPAPFNAGNSAVVYGADAELADMTAAAAIQNNINDALVSDSSAATVSGGDSVLLERTSDKLNLGDSASTVFVTSVDADDMPTLLADGTYSDDGNTEYDFTQKITLGSNLGVEHFADSDYNDKEPTVGIKLSDNEHVLNYTLDFTTHPAYNATTLETTTLTLMGKEYYVLDVKGVGDASTDNKTTLLDAANSAIVSDGGSSTLSVEGTAYDVSISYIGSAEVKLSVNGETTNSLAEGATFKLSDGSYVGIKDIMYDSKDTGISKVEISLGSGKLELTHGSEIELNDDTVNEIIAFMIQDSSSKLDKVVLQWTTDDEAFIADGSDLVMPAFEAVKLSMGGLVTDASEETTVEASGNDVVELKTVINDGAVTIPMLQTNSTGEFQLIGKDSTNRLKTATGTSVTVNQTYGDKYIVASWNSTTEAESYYIKVDMVTESSVNKVRFTNQVTGDEKKVTNASDATFGSVTITVNNVTRDGSLKWADLSINAGGSFNTLYTAEGLKVFLPFEANTSSTTEGAINFSANGQTRLAGHSVESYYQYFDEEDKDGNLAGGNMFNATLDESGTSDKIHVSAVGVNTGADSGEEIADSDNFENYVTSDLASKTMYYTGGDQDSVMITYHGDQAYAELRVSSPDTVIGGESGVAIVDDSASVSGKNVVVVGGSAINSVAAGLLGEAYRGPAFTEATGVGAGEFLIETFAYGSNVALLVAGYEVEDTTKAATYLTNTAEEIMVEVGTKYTGTSATEATLSV
jgi:hypothetical protein